jgi:multidrug efflux pump subunit AcrA (membrane-fusion protein)
VPESAVLRGDGAPLVFVKTGPETFEARPVRVGARAGGSTEILAGLTAGERVVSTGTGALRALAGR